MTLHKIGNDFYLTDPNAEIREGDWITDGNKTYRVKVLLDGYIGIYKIIGAFPEIEGLPLLDLDNITSLMPERVYTEEELREAMKYASSFLSTENGINKYIDQHQASQWVAEIEMENDNEPYFGWCDVEGCENESCNNGGCWRETGYWKCCSLHSQVWRGKSPQPKMKQSAIDREALRDENGLLPYIAPKPRLTAKNGKEYITILRIENHER